MYQIKKIKSFNFGSFFLASINCMKIVKIAKSFICTFQELNRHTGGERRRGGAIGGRTLIINNTRAFQFAYFFLDDNNKYLI